MLNFLHHHIARLTACFGLLFFAVVSHHHPARADNPPLYLERVVELSEGFSKSSINISIFRHSALLTISSNERVVAYYDGQGSVRLQMLDADFGRTKWLRVRPDIPSRLLGDGHCVVSLGISPAGDLVGVYGAHGIGTTAYQFSIPIAKLRNLKSGEVIDSEILPHSITYPQLYSWPGRLELFFRISPSQDIARVVYDVENSRFGEDLQMVLLSGNAQSVYIDRIGINGALGAMSWMYRVDSDQLVPNGVKNVGSFFALTLDGGLSWFDIEGSAFELPIKNDSTRAPHFKIGERARPVNQGSVVYGENSKIYQTFYAKDSQGLYQIFLATTDALTRRVSVSAITQNSEHFELVGRGTLVLPISRADVALSDKYVYVIFREFGRIVIAFRSIKSNENDWGFSYVDVEALGPWEPNYDLEAWENERKLILFVQSTRQGQGDKVLENQPTSVYLYQFSEH